MARKESKARRYRAARKSMRTNVRNLALKKAGRNGVIL